ncbi:MAG: alpha/beta hydrolase [Cyanobacteria bacterium P01_F01_bin.42]
MVNPIQRLGVAALLGASTTFTLFSGSAFAAEKVVMKYGPFSRSVSVESLKSYASSGKASPELASLLRVVKSEQRQSIAGLLNTRLPFNVVQVDRLLRSPIGERFLSSMAEATILPGDSEVKALRSAAILAASEDEALSFGTLLEKYPTETLTINVPVLLRIFQSNAGLGSLLGGGGFASPQEP